MSDTPLEDKVLEECQDILLAGTTDGRLAKAAGVSMTTARKARLRFINFYNDKLLRSWKR